MPVAFTRSMRASVVSSPGIGSRSRSSMRMLPTFRTTRCTKSSFDLSHSKYDSTWTSSPSTGAMSSRSTAAARRRREPPRRESTSAATMNASRAMASLLSQLTAPPSRITNCPADDRRIARRSGYADNTIAPHNVSTMSAVTYASELIPLRRAMSFAASRTRCSAPLSAKSWRSRSSTSRTRSARSAGNVSGRPRKMSRSSNSAANTHAIQP